MATLLLNGTYGPFNPTRASMPFHCAAGAVDADIAVQVLLTADVTLLLKDAVAQAVPGCRDATAHRADRQGGGRRRRAHR